MIYDFYLAKYFMGPTSVSFTDAEAYCLSQGSYLATIQDDSDRDEARTLCATYEDVNSRGCWIGLYHEDALSAWKWSDGSNLGEYGFDSNGNPTTGVDPWYSGEPNNNAEDCIHIFEHKGFAWNDAICSDLYHPICNPGGIQQVPKLLA